MPRIIAPLAPQASRIARPKEEIEQSYAFASFTEPSNSLSESSSSEESKPLVVDQGIVSKALPAPPQRYFALAAALDRRDTYEYSSEGEESAPPKVAQAAVVRDDEDEESSQSSSSSGAQPESDGESAEFRRRKNKKKKALPRATVAVRTVRERVRVEREETHKPFLAARSIGAPAAAVIVIDDDDDDDDEAPSSVLLAGRAAAAAAARREQRQRKAEADRDPISPLRCVADISRTAATGAPQRAAPSSVHVMVLRHGRSVHVLPGFGATANMADVVSALGKTHEVDADDETPIEVVESDGRRDASIRRDPVAVTAGDLVNRHGAESVFAWDFGALRSLLSKPSTMLVASTASSSNRGDHNDSKLGVRRRRDIASTGEHESFVNNSASGSDCPWASAAITRSDPAITIVPSFLDVVDIIEQEEPLAVLTRRQRSVSITPPSGDDEARSAGGDRLPVRVPRFPMTSAPSSASSGGRRLSYRYTLHAVDSVLGTLYYVRQSSGTDVQLRSALAAARLVAAQRIGDFISERISAAAAVSAPPPKSVAAAPLKRGRDIGGEKCTGAVPVGVRKTGAGVGRRKAPAVRSAGARTQDLSILDASSTTIVSRTTPSSGLGGNAGATGPVGISQGAVASGAVLVRQPAAPDADGWFGR
jgi:hypothetical protein